MFINNVRYRLALVASALAIACGLGVMGASAFPDPVQDVKTPGAGPQTALRRGVCGAGSP